MDSARPSLARLDTSALATALSASLDAAVAAGVPGVVAAVTVDGQTVFAGAAGVRVAGEPAPMTIDTVLAIYSMTKAVTGAAAMQLVEQGRLSLDGPAGDVLGDLADVRVLDGFDADDAPILRPARAPVTLRNLLTHTSGFVYEMWNADCAKYLAVTGAPGMGTGRKAALRVPVAFDPGTRWEYGIGIDWAGQLVEAASGQTLGQYCAENLFGPLAMIDTAFSRTPDMASRAARVHLTLPEGVVPLPASGPVDPTERDGFDSGGGGLHSTVADYLRFANMILGGGELDGTRVLQAATVAEMGANHIGDLNVAPMISENPMVSCDADFFPGASPKWGLTFLINVEPSAQGRPAGSLAWAGLANTYYWIDPVNRVCGVWGTQLLPFFSPPAIGGFRSFESAFYRQLAR